MMFIELLYMPSKRLELKKEPPELFKANLVLLFQEGGEKVLSYPHLILFIDRNQLQWVCIIVYVCAQVLSRVFAVQGLCLLYLHSGSGSEESALNVVRSWFYLWVRRMPWRRTQLPTPVFLPGKSCGQRSLSGYSPWGCRRVEGN